MCFAKISEITHHNQSGIAGGSGSYLLWRNLGRVSLLQSLSGEKLDAAGSEGFREKR